MQEVVNGIIINLQKRTEYPKFVIVFLVHFDFLEELVDGSRDHPCEIFISADILEKSVLLLVCLFGSCLEHVFPVLAEHGVGFA